MHSVAVLTDSHPSEAGTICPSDAPIGRYVRVPVEVRDADPRAPEAASCLIALIAAKWPGAPAEHVGSSAVAGLAGKNTIDLLLAAEPAHIPAITRILLELGYQPQTPVAFPASRPMLWGVYRHGQPTTGSMCTWCRRPALRSPPCAASETPYAPTRSCVAALGQLGLGSHQHYRLYEDDPVDEVGRTVAAVP